VEQRHVRYVHQDISVLMLIISRKFAMLEAILLEEQLDARNVLLVIIVQIQEAQLQHLLLDFVQKGIIVVLAAPRLRPVVRIRMVMQLVSIVKRTVCLALLGIAVLKALQISLIACCALAATTVSWAPHARVVLLVHTILS